jgi:alpha-ketoglutarate-dependent 2,4-dichlorophenoxyacetate dioxygenase
MKITALVPGFVSAFEDVDLRTATGPDLAHQVIAALGNTPVVVFRGQDIDDELQLRFAASLGRLRCVGGTPYIGTAGNVDDDGNLIAEDDQRQWIARGSRVWHTDLSFRRLPDRYTLLTSRVVPSSGGNTQFCNTYAAYEALDAAERHKLDGLVAVHDLRYSRSLLGLGLTPAEQARDFVTPQPLVLEHPRTGRRSLYLARHICDIAGMPNAETRLLVDRLLDHAVSPRFVYELEWGAPGVLAIWDNRATMHRGMPYADLSEPRVMRRCAVISPGVV